MDKQMLKAALAYAARGWPVFPCRADKTPLTENGVLQATTNRATIERWWRRWPKANVATHVGEAGLMVLDLDPGHSVAEIEKAVGPLPKTKLVQRSPRGGTHLFFALDEGEIVSPSASKLARHVDVRSFNSYVLLAPSRTKDGAYSWESEGKPAYRTDEMVRVANAYREKHEDRDNWIIEPDLPENVAAAIEWLALEAKPAVEGQGGDHTMYATAAMMKSFGISEAMAFDLIWEHYNPRCRPPWGEDQLEHIEAKIENSYRYNTSPPGNMTKAFKEAKAREMFKPKRQPLATGNEMRAGRFRFTDRLGMNSIAPPEWLVHDLLPSEGYAIFFGEHGTFKTFIALDIALSVASDLGVIRPTWEVGKNGAVVFSLGEGRPGFRKRVEAWEAVHTGGVPVENFYIVDPVPHAADEEGLGHFVEGLDAFVPEDQPIRLIVIDTIGRAMQGLNENTAEDAGKMTKLVETLQRTFGCAVLCLAHAGKDGNQRGSTGFPADADTIVKLERKSKTDMTVALRMMKQKDAPEWDHVKHVRLNEIDLGDMGKGLAVLQPEPGSEVAEVKHEQAKEAFEKAAEDRQRGPRSAVALALVDEIACAVLEAAAGLPMNDSDLAIRIHESDRIDADVTAETIRKKYLKAIKESKSFKAHAYYHVRRAVGAGRWLARKKS